MASNKDTNSSKTAHVMSLLSKNRGSSSTPAPDPAAVEEEKASPAAEPVAESTPAASQVPPLLSSLEADAAVSSQIKDALELELDLDAQETASAEASPKNEPEAKEDVSADELMGVPQSSSKVPEADLPPAPPPSQEENPCAITYTNVMQILVEEKAEKYMKMFGICCCEHCQVDVKSYALNHLPPKYVVMAPDERVPKLTVYESKYSSDITAQLIQACKVVMATPHHARPE